ncbi:two component transcriptional regulator, LuxR family [Bifidobacterium italicum]|uniref:Two component transcriptional regulator, LuxR family n=1 Tax=Bifidobacterium italicum TaxID=1960968 RepID=A0A2A2EME4_9BIFI|nr:response regulator transcription factor [Bifidobacterium italicum]PAU70070.1 two component transcriptional regulator, LuxR family [Bifidobacterium italicum]
MRKTTIAIMDDDIWCLKSLGSWLGGRPHLCTLLWQTSSSDEALQRCLNGRNAQQPQALLLDMSFDIASAPEICRQIRSETDSISILGMSSGMCESYIEVLAQAGAQGIIAKRHLAKRLPSALSLLAVGKSIDPARFKNTTEAHADLAGTTTIQQKPLSVREAQVLHLYSRHNTTQQIANQLGVSLSTVYTFAHRAMEKLQVDTITAAIYRFQEDNKHKYI